MAYYINNEVLRKTIEYYNNHNVYDDFDWIPKYIEKLTNKYKTEKMTKEQYEINSNFINKKIKMRDELLERYKNMSESEKTEFNKKLDHYRSELCAHFTKISVGRANSMYLHKSIQDTEEVKDILTDTLISMINYCSRYDTDRGTSCFAYMTQIATNAIKQGINSYRTRTDKFITGLDFYENLDGGVDSENEIEDLCCFD